MIPRFFSRSKETKPHVEPYSPIILSYLTTFFGKFPTVHFFRIGMLENEVFIEPSQPVFRCFRPFCKHWRICGETYYNPYSFREKMNHVDAYCGDHCGSNNPENTFARGAVYSNFVSGAQGAYVDWDVLTEHKSDKTTSEVWQLLSKIAGGNTQLAIKEGLELKVICHVKKNTFTIFTVGNYVIKTTNKPYFGHTWTEAMVYYDMHSFNAGHAYWWGCHGHKSLDEPIFSYLNLKGKKSIEFREDCVVDPCDYEVIKVSEVD